MGWSGAGMLRRNTMWSWCFLHLLLLLALGGCLPTAMLRSMELGMGLLGTCGQMNIFLSPGSLRWRLVHGGEANSSFSSHPGAGSSSGSGIRGAEMKPSKYWPQTALLEWTSSIFQVVKCNERCKQSLNRSQTVDYQSYTKPGEVTLALCQAVDDIEGCTPQLYSWATKACTRNWS